MKQILSTKQQQVLETVATEIFSKNYVWDFDDECEPTTHCCWRDDIRWNSRFEFAGFTEPQVVGHLATLKRKGFIATHSDRESGSTISLNQIALDHLRSTAIRLEEPKP